MKEFAKTSPDKAKAKQQSDQMKKKEKAAKKEAKKTKQAQQKEEEEEEHVYIPPSTLQHRPLHPFALGGIPPRFATAQAFTLEHFDPNN